MKRKPLPKPVEPVDEDVIEVEEPETPAVLQTAEGSRGAEKCSVCGGISAVAGEDRLCWVCRHLKISAWRDTDSQMPTIE